MTGPTDGPAPEALLPADDWEAQTRQVLRVLAQVVADFGPDHVNPQTVRVSESGFVSGPECWYVNASGDGPDCLVGQVLYRLGIPLADMRECEGRGPWEASGKRLSHEAAGVLGMAQHVQDGGGTWGEALDTAIAYARIHFGITVVGDGE